MHTPLIPLHPHAHYHSQIPKYPPFPLPLPTANKYMPKMTYDMVSKEEESRQGDGRANYYETAEEMQQKVEILIEQVSKIISGLLDNLKYLYQNNGIRYEIDHYYQMLIKLLTPYELLSHYHIIDNCFLFANHSPSQNQSQQTKDQALQCKFQRRYNELLRKNESRNKNRLNRRRTQVNDQNKSQANYIDEKSIEKNLKSIKQQVRARQSRSKLKGQEWYDHKSNKSDNYKKQKKIKQDDSQIETSKFNHNGTSPTENKNDGEIVQGSKYCKGNRPILSQIIQKKLVLWIIEQLVSKRPLKLREIAKHAKQLSLADNLMEFKSSRGWVFRFLIRHPYLREMMIEGRAGNYDTIVTMYMNIRDKLLGRSSQVNKNVHIKQLQDSNVIDNCRDQEQVNQKQLQGEEQEQYQREQQGSQGQFQAFEQQQQQEDKNSRGRYQKQAGMTYQSDRQRYPQKYQWNPDRGITKQRVNISDKKHDDRNISGRNIMEDIYHSESDNSRQEIQPQPSTNRIITKQAYHHH